MSQQPESIKLVRQLDEVLTSLDQLLAAPYGQQGASIITDTVAHFGDWYCIVSIEDGTTTGASSTMNCNWDLNGAGGGNENTAFTHANLALPTGVPLYGHFTKITLSVGKVIAYKR